MAAASIPFPEQDRPIPGADSLQKRSCRFEELNLQVDHRLQIEPATARLGEHFYTRLLGYLKGSSLIVKLPTSWDGAVPLGEGDVVTVRGFSGRIAYAFSSDILKIRYAPYPYCHLSFPPEIQGVEIRKALRVRVNIPARLINVNESGSAYEATISDLSTLGVQLNSTDDLGKMGDNVTLTFRFWVQPGDYEVNFNASGIIQSAQPIDSEAAGWRYGVRLNELRSTEAILLQNLIYEQLMETHSLSL